MPMNLLDTTTNPHTMDIEFVSRVSVAQHVLPLQFPMFARKKRKADTFSS